MQNVHSFHIPVMGIGFTLESPMKVAQYGIASAMSLVDDMLIEKLRKVYSEKFDLPYKEISEKMEDFRARRITAYLNLVQTVVRKNYDELKKSASDKSNDLKKYFDLLPNGEQIKAEFNEFISKLPSRSEMEDWLKDKLSMGSIDVNIMTKIDKVNFKDGEALSHEYNDAHAAIRGFANSDLSSSVVLSAGMNPRLYGYLANFPDFFPDEQGQLRKKIILKVSDYRSALIQGKFLAKKGLWVSEYRIESGLNCGGHAFATDGNLMGPVLAEFRDNKKELYDAVFDIVRSSLESNEDYRVPDSLPLKITAQGGVGTAEEHDFLMQHYALDSVGWGSPFLLVPEATTLDEATLRQLADAGEDDLYLSGISPLGVPFNNLRGNSKDLERDENIAKGRPGSSCPKKYVSVNNEFSDKIICTASREYQHLKLKQLDGQGLATQDHQKQVDTVTEKSCICVGLGTGTLLVHGLDTSSEGTGVSICPGPNMAYFDQEMSLQDMTDHIYGRHSIIKEDRPHMFVKELGIYINFLKKRMEEMVRPIEGKDLKYINKFSKNLKDGIRYYHELVDELQDRFVQSRAKIKKELDAFWGELDEMEKGMG